MTENIDTLEHLCKMIIKILLDSANLNTPKSKSKNNINFQFVGSIRTAK